MQPRRKTSIQPRRDPQLAGPPTAGWWAADVAATAQALGQKHLAPPVGTETALLLLSHPLCSISFLLHQGGNGNCQRSAHSFCPMLPPA